MNFLERVIKQKEIEIARKRSEVPAAELERLAEALPPRDFEGALAGERRIIAELKKRSPRVASFRQAGALEALATQYEANGAAAVSVVTDEANFGTSLADARRVRDLIGLPVLVKDFFVDPYQILEARSAGADAVLLISRILPVDVLSSLIERTRSLGIAALVEVHSREDVGRALEAGAPIFGINNRNLGSLEVSLDTTRDLIGLVPGDALVVSESGISCREQIEALSALGVGAFLIGGALLNSTDPGRLLATLVG
ncbi:MAG: indole-3-glycerol-phosphate synthase [Candidatus Krumholzibacteriia bacterium]